MPASPIRSCLLDDPYLAPYDEIIRKRSDLAAKRAAKLASTPGALAEFACAHEYYGLHKTDAGWIFREWAPNATSIWLVGDFSGWQVRDAFRLQRIPGRDVWELALAADTVRQFVVYAALDRGLTTREEWRRVTACLSVCEGPGVGRQQPLAPSTHTTFGRRILNWKLP